jgi:DNA-directed RNA polymerase subunit alpha
MPDKLDVHIPLPLDLVGPTVTPSAPAGPAHSEHLSRSVDELELSVRTANCLQDANIRYVGEIARMTELNLLTLKNFGRKNLRELTEILAELGLTIGMTLDGWSPPEA